MARAGTGPETVSAAAAVSMARAHVITAATAAVALTATAAAAASCAADSNASADATLAGTGNPQLPELSWGEGDSGGHAVRFGEPGSLGFRMMFLDRRDRIVSPWHNIPLYGENSWLNCVCATPSGSWLKHEFAPEEYTPLRVAPKRGEPSHFCDNATWNLGLLPQTWQDPEELVEEFPGMMGCGSPLEVIDVSGGLPANLGQVYTIKPLGVIPVVREAGLAWVVVGIGAGDLLASLMNHVDDVYALLPGTMESVIHWLTICDTTEPGDPPAVLASDDSYGADKALEVIAQAHAAWQLFLHSNVQPEPWRPDLDVFSTNVLQACWRKYTDGQSAVVLPVSCERRDESVPGDAYNGDEMLGAGSVGFGAVDGDMADEEGVERDARGSGGAGKGVRLLHGIPAALRAVRGGTAAAVRMGRGPVRGAL
ncbi:unnamed protein product [Closterium sp. Yama58-4]|nr:unnamed protein product [Closterium sp. Yama58-4]